MVGCGVQMLWVGAWSLTVGASSTGSVEEMDGWVWSYMYEEVFEKIYTEYHAKGLAASAEKGSGNHYVLVLCDYATGYLEAVALWSVDAED